jgi:hypothetical protein
MDSDSERLGERCSLLRERLGNLVADLPDYRGNQVIDWDYLPPRVDHSSGIVPGPITQQHP